MTKLRYLTTLVTGLLFAAYGLFVATPAAFAMRVVPPQGDAGPATPTYIVTRSGMDGWQVTFIAVGVALAAVALTALALRLRFHSRLRPAAG
jgi:hypothetical protein